jgi:hypothetical protein
MAFLTMEILGQPVAADGNGFRFFGGSMGGAICNRLPPVATTGSRKAPSIVVSTGNIRRVNDPDPHSTLAAGKGRRSKGRVIRSVSWRPRARNGCPFGLGSVVG